MTRFTTLLGLLSGSLLFGSLLFGQQDWQGEVKKLYPLSVPAFQGVSPVFGLAQKTATTPDIELYSLSLKLADLKASAGFFRDSLEKQGFKPVKTTSGPTVEKIQMTNASRKLMAVVVASKQNATTMLLGITVMPEGTLK